MKRILTILFMFFLLVGTASAVDVCIWKDCPQPGDQLKAGYVHTWMPPTIQLIPNINLNGETNYIFWRKEEDGGTGFGVGIGTTLAILYDIIDIDAKYIKLTDNDSSDLFGVGMALDILNIINKMNGQLTFPEPVAIKIGIQGLLDTTHDYHLCGGAYAKLKFIF